MIKPGDTVWILDIIHNLPTLTEYQVLKVRNMFGDMPRRRVKVYVKGYQFEVSMYTNILAYYGRGHLFHNKHEAYCFVQGYLNKMQAAAKAWQETLNSLEYHSNPS